MRGLPRPEIIHHERSGDDQQSEEFPGLFDPGLFGLHAFDDTWPLVLDDPIAYTVGRKEEDDRIDQVETDKHKVNPGIELPENGKSAAGCGGDIDGYPQPGVDIVQVQVREIK